MIFKFNNIRSFLHKTKRAIDKSEKELRVIKVLNKYLNKEYGFLALKNHTNCEFDEAPNIVWVMWWQGLESMPDSVKICYNSLMKNANGYIINLITKDNINNFIQLPKFVYDKVNANEISLTHLSDLIRATLLNQFGGFWLDATILVTRPLPNLKELTYWSPKWKLKSKDKRKYRLWYGLWKISGVPELTISHCMGIWYSRPQNPIFKSLSEFWVAYWEKEKSNTYYWTTEVFLLGTLYEQNAVIAELIDKVPYNNPKCLELSEIINKPFEESIFLKLQKETSFFYLRWKSEYHDFDLVTNQPTLFKNLKNKYLI